MKSYFVPSTHIHLSVSGSLNYYTAKFREAMKYKATQLNFAQIEFSQFSSAAGLVLYIVSIQDIITPLISLVYCEISKLPVLSTPVAMVSYCLVEKSLPNFRSLTFPPCAAPQKTWASLSFLCLVKDWHNLADLKNGGMIFGLLLPNPGRFNPSYEL